jgi:hypothetical protein
MEVRTIEYQGWHESVEITNGTGRLVVVPAIGRIMFYGFEDGANVLWENPEYLGKILPPEGPIREKGESIWMNFGGDKVWPAQQDHWKDLNGYDWPPDPWFDGGIHSVRILDDGVKIKSPVSEFNGARSEREIRLAPMGTRVSIHQTIEKVKASRKASIESIPFTIWNITQIRQPEQILIPLNPISRFKERYFDYLKGGKSAAGNVRIADSVAVFIPDPTADQKIGADSGPWISGVVGNLMMVEFFKRRNRAAYPDGGVSMSAYTCPDYAELELMGPLKELRIGDILEHDIAWELFRLPEYALTVNEKREAALQVLSSK